MKNIVFLRENKSGESRCSVMPSNIKRYVKMGAKVLVEAGIGASIGILDHEYSDAGGTVISDRTQLLAQADVILGVHKLPENELAYTQRDNATLISFLDPFNSPDYLAKLNEHKLTALSVEMIPRSSYCQKMDALSSQASLAGYVMVMNAFNTLNRIAPMMMTPSGTIKPTKVFVIGAGVAGLQAIATAKRLGAQVTAYDTRSVVAEQVRSLGAKFLEIDLGETGQTEQGYAKALTAKQIAKQQSAQEQCIIDSDIVITTAQLFGRKPPVLIKQPTLFKMKPGSVVVDMAAESGGNVEGSRSGQATSIGPVSVLGFGNWSNQVAKDASQMYANNIEHLIAEFWCQDTQSFKPDSDSDIWRSCCITTQGSIVNKLVNDVLKQVA